MPMKLALFSRTPRPPVHVLPPPGAPVARGVQRPAARPVAARSSVAPAKPAEALRVWDEGESVVRPVDRDRLVAQAHLDNGRPVEAGHLFAQLGRTREAAEAYEAGQEWAHAAYRWEATSEPARAARAYEKAGQPRHAARCYAAAGMTGPAADAYVQAGDLGAAVELLVRAGQAVAAASLYLERGDRARAAQILLRLQPRDPDFAAGTVLLAPLLIKEGFADDALERLRRLPPETFLPSDVARAAERFYWEGRALDALEKESEALACYGAAVDLDPGHRDARERLDRQRCPAPAPTPAPAAVVTGATAPRPEVLAVGGRIAGRYDILAELGRGGMGRVYQAHDLELGETVAIKALLGAGDGGCGEESRLLQEIQICRRISHPNVVRVFDMGRFAGGIFLTMEYLEGCCLSRLIATEGPLPFARIRALLAETAAGLREAHALGIVHRDLKPSNLMLTPTRLKILDFGIASMAGIQAHRTQAGFVLGSPMYMSPEQILGQPLDGRSDLYSLGLLTHTLITGRDPHEAHDPDALVLRQLQQPPSDLRSLRPETPEPWLALVDKLCAKRPEDRCQSAQEVLDLLADLPVE